MEKKDRYRKEKVKKLGKKIARGRRSFERVCLRAEESAKFKVKGMVL